MLAAKSIQTAAAFIMVTLIFGFVKNVFVHSIPNSIKIKLIPPQKMDRIANDRKMS